MALALARRESTCGGGSSGGVAFCQGDWDVNSQGGEGERLATGIVGHFERWLRVGSSKMSRVHCVMSFFFKRTRNPGCLGVRLSCLVLGSSMCCSGRVASRRGDSACATE
jgi:hypothetical protein